MVVGVDITRRIICRERRCNNTRWVSELLHKLNKLSFKKKYKQIILWIFWNIRCIHRYEYKINIDVALEIWVAVRLFSSLRNFIRYVSSSFVYLPHSRISNETHMFVVSRIVKRKLIKTF